MMLLLLALLPIWGASAVYRCSDRTVRRYLVAATSLMVFWIILVILKYAATSPKFEEAAWYLMYVPMLFLPLLVLLGVLRSTQLDRHPRANTASAAAVFVSALLVVAVLSNAAHHLAFRPRSGPESFAYDYEYGPLYWVVVAWLFTVFLAAGVALFAFGRRQLRRALFLVSLVGLVALVFGGLYASRHQPVFSTNMSVVYVMLLVVSTELALRLGLLPSLSWSAATLESLPLDLRVLSYDGQEVLRTGQRAPLSPREIRDIQYRVGPEFADPKTTVRLTLAPSTETDPVRRLFRVPGGWGLETWDLSSLHQTRRALRQKQEQLRASNQLLTRDLEIQSHLTELRHERRYLDEVERSLTDTVGKIQAHLAEIATLAPAADGERESALEQVRLLVSHVKIRGNLVLARHGKGTISPGAIELLLSQTASDFRLSGLECASLVRLTDELPAETAEVLVDLLFDFTLSSAACLNPAVLVHLAQSDSCVEMRLAHTCDSSVRMDYRVPDSLDEALQQRGGAARVEGDADSLTLVVRHPSGGER